MKKGENRAYHRGKSPSYKGRQKQRGKGTMEIQNNQKAINKMTVVSSYISIITLKMNGLNSPIKRHRVAGWIKNTD